MFNAFRLLDHVLLSHYNVLLFVSFCNINIISDFLNQLQYVAFVTHMMVKCVPFG